MATRNLTMVVNRRHARGKEKGLAIQHFKDDATAFNNQKKANVEGKGVLNNRISEYILSNLAQCGIKTHLVKRLNMREQLIRKAEIFPIEFIVRNIATGSLTKRLDISEGTVLEKPLLEYCYKKDELEDPLVSKEHIYSFGWATKEEMNIIDKRIFYILILSSFQISLYIFLSFLSEIMSLYYYAFITLSRVLCNLFGILFMNIHYTIV